ncbi:hypothetical protein DMENIID0001_143730 [Sergentomyia squamirostris]
MIIDEEASRDGGRRGKQFHRCSQEEASFPSNSQTVSNSVGQCRTASRAGQQAKRERRVHGTVQESEEEGGDAYETMSVASNYNGLWWIGSIGLAAFQVMINRFYSYFTILRTLMTD